MNNDLAIIAKVLEGRNYSDALRAGVDRPGMLGPEATIYWSIIRDHHDTYHEVPTVELFRQSAPSYHHVVVRDSLEALVDRVKTVNLNRELEKILTQVAKAGAKDPWEAKSTLINLVDGLAMRHNKGNNYYIVGEDREETLAMLDKLKTKHGLTGYPWPWEYFNQNSRGVGAGEIYYIYGRQKSRKTFLLLFMALYYWAIGLKVLMFTREMSFEQLKWRLISLSCGYDYGDTTKNLLPEGSRDQIDRMLTEVFDSGRFIICDVGEGVGGFKAAIEDTGPDIIFHDYFKAMADDAMGDKVNGESRYVARVVDQVVDYVSRKAKVPLFMVGHANREGARTKGRSSTEHAWSDHITRRVHGAFRVVTHGPTNRTAMFLNAARSMQEGIGITISSKLCDGFGEMLGTDYSWINTVDSEEEETPKGGGRKSTPQKKKKAEDNGAIDIDSFR